MAQPIYSTSVVIDSFKGLNQTGDGANMNMRYAAEMENVNVHNGSFSPMREGAVLEQELGKPIGTLAYLSRRYITNPDTLMVAISDGRVFTKKLDGDDAWEQRYPPKVGGVEHGTPLTVSDCDWLTYEVNEYPVYLKSRGYAVGERCKYKKGIGPYPDPVLISVSIYTMASNTTYYGPYEENKNKWRTLNVQMPSGDMSNIIQLYSSESTYAVGEYVAVEKHMIPDGELYYRVFKCKTAINTPEELDLDHWNYYKDFWPYNDRLYYHYGSVMCLENYDRDPEEEPEEEQEYKNYVCTTAITTPEDWDEDNWEEIEDSDPVDVLLFTNAKDGMYCLYGDTLQVVPVWVTPDPENNPTENIKFGVIARYNERIWGSGISGDPDKLMYSASYNPFDWTLNDEFPEDGAGDILQPTWDGDSFLALKQFGSDLLAFKRNSVWRIYGTHPGEFVMTRQYGGGTIVENTVAVQDQYMYMLGEHGLMRYDGVGAYAFLQDVIQKLMHDVVNNDSLDKACAAMRNGIYCLALPVHGSEFCNAILEYNPMESTFALRTNISVDSFLQYDERLFYTSATEPGKVFELTDEVGHPLPCKWISGYQDLELKNSIKSAFILYMMVDSEAPVELRVGIETEKKLKQKIIYTKPKKMTRLHLNTQGRQFRLVIESYSGIPFTIAGGVKLDLELDPD